MTEAWNKTACVVWPVFHDPEYSDDRIKSPHVTVVFLGDTENLPPAEEIVEVLKGKTAVPRPSLWVEEHKVYGQEQKFDVVTIEKREDFLEMRQRMVDALAEAGISDASSWPDYSPHMTLGPEGCGHYSLNTVYLESPVLWYNGKTYQIDSLPLY